MDQRDGPSYLDSLDEVRSRFRPAFVDKLPAEQERITAAIFASLELEPTRDLGV